MAKSTNQDGFEEKLQDLESLIAEIEAGKDGLNKSIEKYSEAQRIAGELEKLLEGAKKTLEKEDEALEEEEE